MTKEYAGLQINPRSGNTHFSLPTIFDIRPASRISRHEGLIPPTSEIRQTEMTLYRIPTRTAGELDLVEQFRPDVVSTAVILAGRVRQFWKAGTLSRTAVLRARLHVLDGESLER